MLRFLQKLSLPLLLKELTEQSARRRTYIIRVVYVTLFCLACILVMLGESPGGSTAPLAVLGTGRNIFIAIVGWQFAGIYLFLPALACTVLTIEKERNTIGLLFLTRLGPWTIVMEKLASRLLPMYFLMLCSLPLLAFSISLGGVNTSDMFTAVWFLALTAFQVCSIAVACSSVFRTTTAALLTCYLVLFVLIFGLPISDWLLFDNSLREFTYEILQMWYGQQFNPRTGMGVGPVAEMFLFCMFGFAQFIIRMEAMFAIPRDLFMFSLSSGPLLLSGLLPIPIARFFLVRCAFVAPKNWVLIILRWVDRVFHRLNNNPLTRGRVILDESRSEPDFSPIAWRETHKRSLGRAVYLIRIFLALELPVLAMMMAMIFRVAGDFNNMDHVLNVATILVWLIVSLLVTVTSSSSISGERSRQTLDILLTMPCSGKKIVVDKIAGVRRLMWMCSVPLITCITFEAWWRDVIGYRSYNAAQHNYIWWNYYFTALSMVFTYLPLMCWLSVWISLKTKSPTRATLTALITVVVWCAVPLIVLHSWWAIWMQPHRSYTGEMGLQEYSMLLQLSPLGLLMQAETGSLDTFSSIPLLPMLLNVILYGSCGLLLRARVLTYADRLLGRSEPPILMVDPLPHLDVPGGAVQAPSLAD